MGPNTKHRVREIVRIQSVHFLGEQDGAPEREVKKRLSDLFGHAAWAREAYLARVTYNGGRLNQFT
jgi:hypothetical protein